MTTAWDLESKFLPQTIAAAISKTWNVHGGSFRPAVDSCGVTAQCPITLEPFEEPAMLADGTVYEQAAVLDWLRNHSTAPCTNVPLPHKVVLRLGPMKAVAEHLMAETPTGQLEHATKNAARELKREAPDVRALQQACQVLDARYAEGAAEVQKLQALMAEAQKVRAKLRQAIDPTAALQIQTACKRFISRNIVRAERDRNLQVMVCCIHPPKGAGRKKQAPKPTLRHLSATEQQRLQLLLRSAHQIKATAQTFVARITLLRALLLSAFCKMSKNLFIATVSGLSKQVCQSMVIKGANVNFHVEGLTSAAFPLSMNFKCEVCDSDHGYDKPSFRFFCSANERLLRRFRTNFNAREEKNLANSLYGSSALHFTAMKGGVALARYLCESNAEVEAVDKWRQTPMILGAWGGHVEMIKVLCEFGAQVNTCDREGKTPLLVSAFHGHTNTVRILCENGANIDMPDSFSQNALMMACQHDEGMEVVQLLVELGCNKNMTDQHNRCCLLIAASCGHVNMVRTLCDAGANKEVTDVRGQTALLKAAREGHLECLRLLVEAGGNKDIADKEGNNSLLWAFRRNDQDAIRYLGELGVKEIKGDATAKAPKQIKKGRG